MLEKGTYADIYSYKDNQTQKNYAVKCYLPNTNAEEIKSEIDIYESLKKFQNQNVYIITYEGI